MALLRAAGQWLTRRRILLGGGTTLGAFAAGARAATPATEAPDHVALALAKQEIAELRRRYALATDLIGTGEPASVARGRSIYEAIFTADAQIGATGRAPVVGPEAWVRVVREALGVYAATQHLIGTQLVDVARMPQGDRDGEARMSSYLQAWHAQADGEVFIFIGTYQDRVRYRRGDGWRIEAMHLAQVSGERRPLGRLPG